MIMSSLQKQGLKQVSKATVSDVIIRKVGGRPETINRFLKILVKQGFLIETDKPNLYDINYDKAFDSGL